MGNLSRFSPAAVLSAFCAFLAASLRSRAALPSRPEDFHHQPLTEPCVRVSPYTARRGFKNASLRKRPVSEGKRFVLVTQLASNPHPTTSSAWLHPHYRDFMATIG